MSSPFAYFIESKEQRAEIIVTARDRNGGRRGAHCADLTVRSTITRSGSPEPPFGNVRLRPDDVCAKSRAFPLPSTLARVTRTPTRGIASRRSRQSSTCTNTVSPRWVVTPHGRGETGPAWVL